MALGELGFDIVKRGANFNKLGGLLVGGGLMLGQLGLVLQGLGLELGKFFGLERTGRRNLRVSLVEFARGGLELSLERHSFLAGGVPLLGQLTDLSCGRLELGLERHGFLAGGVPLLGQLTDLGLEGHGFLAGGIPVVFLDSLNFLVMLVLSVLKLLLEIVNFRLKLRALALSLKLLYFVIEVLLEVGLFGLCGHSGLLLDLLQCLGLLRLFCLKPRVGGLDLLKQDPLFGLDFGRTEQPRCVNGIASSALHALELNLHELLVFLRVAHVALERLDAFGVAVKLLLHLVDGLLWDRLLLRRPCHHLFEHRVGLVALALQLFDPGDIPTILLFELVHPLLQGRILGWGGHHRIESGHHAFAAAAPGRDLAGRRGCEFVALALARRDGDPTGLLPCAVARGLKQRCLACAHDTH